MRRRSGLERNLGGLREARCRWYYERQLQPAGEVARWGQEHPFPGGYGDVSVELLVEQAQCDCRWCTAFDDEVDPREWVRAVRGA